MWNVYVVDESGPFQANSQPLDIIEAELLAEKLSDLVVFLFPAGRDLPAGFLFVSVQVGRGISSGGQ